jgi:hypothetical protein
MRGWIQIVKQIQYERSNMVWAIEFLTSHPWSNRENQELQGETPREYGGWGNHAIRDSCDLLIVFPDF